MSRGAIQKCYIRPIFRFASYCHEIFDIRVVIILDIEVIILSRLIFKLLKFPIEL